MTSETSRAAEASEAADDSRRAERALVLTAASADQEALERALDGIGVPTEICADIEALRSCLDDDVGCAVIAEECLSQGALALLRESLATRPSWSELPIIVMTRRGESPERSSQVVRQLGGVARVTLLERPVALLTLTSAVRAALQSRRQQYRVRETIAKLSRAERSLKESESRLRLAVQSGPVVLFGQDRDLRYTWVVHPVDDLVDGSLLGRSDEEILGREQSAALSVIKRRVMKNGIGARTEQWIERDGKRTAWDLNLEPLWNELGEVVGLTGVAVEITERKGAERNLERAEARLRAAMVGSGLGIFEYDPIEDRLDASARSWEIITGAGEPQVGGLDAWLRVIHPEDRERTETVWRQACQPGTDGSFETEYRVVREDDGSTRWVTARSSPFEEAESGSRRRLIGTVQDVTEDRAAEERLRVLTSDLEQRVAARTKELQQRTSQLRRLANQLVSAEQRERARLAQMLHDHLQQILAAAKIQIDLFQGRFEEQDLNEKLKDVQELLEKAVSASRSLSLELSPPALQNGPLEGALRWQAQWMESHHRLQTEVRVESELPRIPAEVKILLFEAVRELLFNVVKHAEVSHCRLRLWSEDGKLGLSVEDEGKGFAPEQLTKAKDEGFGLFSIRERVEAIGGVMEVESAPGKGATFRLYVPGIAVSSTVHERPGGRALARSTGGSAHKIRLLVVDDHPIVRDGIISMLRRSSDIEVVGEAADGEEAIDLVDLLKPDVIVMDLNMPGMGGAEATRQIKRRHPYVSIVGLSVQSEEAAVEEMVRAGASAFLTKGGRSEVLFDTLRRVADHR